MKRVITALLAVIATFALATAGAQDKKTRISIGTGGTGGVYYPLGGGLAAALSKYVPRVEAHGLDPKKDMTRERLSVAESVNALKDRKIDAFFWVGGVPTPSITDLAATPGIKVKLVDHGEGAENMRNKYGPIYVKNRILANAY